MPDASPVPGSSRPVIYQLLVRLFGNTRADPKFNGTLGENGCGKFADINGAALAALKEMGFTHLWLTGVMEQASGTAYPARPADPPDLLKGIAGSPYAIRDCFDVCPDYAVDPDRRMEEFSDLLGRCHSAGFKVIVDFVPNHVARSYTSDVRPELSFGAGDDRSVFFHRDNHFYYLRNSDPGDGPPLRLPTDGLPRCTGCYPPEAEHGRVTGNNAITWAPSIHDWYETVKLNYGHDFTTGRDTSHLPGPEADVEEVPKTWRTMDEVIAYWQGLGVDGFRVDMAHMVPMEFWAWMIRRARSRNPRVFFFAEAYDNDPAKLTDGHVLDALLAAGFDSVYDDPAYDIAEGIYLDGKWANDLDALQFTGGRFHKSLRYAENHDEVRLANPNEWGGLGMKVGRPVTAVLFAMGRGPQMLYHGQEVGEPAIGAEGFCGDNARTSIFDYTSMPQFVKWVNGGRYDGGGLSPEQKELRAWYGRLIRLTRDPAFTDGGFYGLNHANHENPAFGRVGDEAVSGHWLHAFLRNDEKTMRTFLVVANFHGSHEMENVRVRIPDHAREFIGHPAGAAWTFTEKLQTAGQVTADDSSISTDGLPIGNLPPCEARMFLLERAG